MMAALKSTLLRDHLCWLWRMGSDSCDETLSDTALLAEQVLRVLGVEHESLDLMLCQVSSTLTCLHIDGATVGRDSVNVHPLRSR